MQTRQIISNHSDRIRTFLFSDLPSMVDRHEKPRHLCPCRNRSSNNTFCTASDKVPFRSSRAGSILRKSLRCKLDAKNEQTFTSQITAIAKKMKSTIHCLRQIHCQLDVNHLRVRIQSLRHSSNAITGYLIILVDSTKNLEGNLWHPKPFTQIWRHHRANPFLKHESNTTQSGSFELTAAETLDNVHTIYVRKTMESLYARHSSRNAFQTYIYARLMESLYARLSSRYNSILGYNSIHSIS